MDLYWGICQFIYFLLFCLDTLSYLLENQLGAFYYDSSLTCLLNKTFPVRQPGELLTPRLRR